MADPTLAEIVTTSFTIAGGTDYDLDISAELAEINADELVIITYNVVNGGGFQTQTAAEAQGWTFELNERAGTSFRAIQLWKQLVGTETIVTLDSAAASRDVICEIRRYQDWGDVDFSAFSSRLGSPYSSNTITASGGAAGGGDNHEFVSWLIHGDQTIANATLSTRPTGYTENQSNLTDATNNIQLHSASKLSSSASDTPSDWDLTGSSTGSQWAYTQGAVITRGTNGPSGGGATTLVAADLTHSHTMDAGALTQAHTLVGDDLAIGHSLDAGVLAQGYSLTGQALDQSQTIDNAVLTQAHVLVAADLLHGHTIDSGVLTVAGALAGDDLSQTQALDLGALTQHNVLAGQDLSQGQTIDSAVLVVAGALNADPLTQSQIIEAAALVQNYVLSGQDLTQSQEIDSGVLSTGIDLTAQDLTHAQTIDAGALTQYHVLTADSLTQAQILQAATLGGVVIGELEGEIVIYAAIGGDVYTFPALAGTVH